MLACHIAPQKDLASSCRPTQRNHPCVFARIEVLVDAHLPGRERALHEAALFDVLPLVADDNHGAARDVFPRR